MKKLYSFFALSLITLSVAATPGLNKTNYPDSVRLMRMNLYDFNADGSAFRIDGTMTQYGDSYSNDIDGEDGRKMTNPGVNVCLLRDNVNLVVERRHTIVSADTIFFKIWGLMNKTYQLKFVAVHLDQPGLEAFLEDSYLHTTTPVSLTDTTDINIEINSDPASSYRNRFRLIYKSVTLVAPVMHLTALPADQQNPRMLLNWNTENQDSIKKYWIQRSSDGLNFSDVGVVNVPNPVFNNYEWVDPFPSNGVNYYRIKSVAINGKADFSETIKIKGLIKKANKIALFPNPATTSNMNLNLENQPAGKYQVRFYNSYGQAVLEQSFDFRGGDGIQKLSSNQALVPGVYHLQVIKPGGDKEVLEVVF
jgi:hypothetical protein